MESGASASSVQLLIALLVGGIGVLIAAIGFFMRGWFAGLRADILRLTNAQEAAERSHSEQHEGIWAEIKTVRSTAERADNAVQTHVRTKHSIVIQAKPAEE